MSAEINDQPPNNGGNNTPNSQNSSQYIICNIMDTRTNTVSPSIGTKNTGRNAKMKYRGMSSP